MEGGAARSPGRPIRVVVVDDSELLLETLVATLGCRPDVDVVGTAGDAATAAAVVADLEPDVVLLDLRLGDAWGLDLVPALRVGDHPPAIVVFSASSQQVTADAAAQAGVHAQVTKGASVEEIAAVLHAAADPRRGGAAEGVQMGPWPG